MSTVRMLKSALRFLFNAMAPKQIEGFLFQGIPNMIYLDNGPVARSHVFQQVMRYLDVDVRAHLPQGKDGRRVTARSKGACAVKSQFGKGLLRKRGMHLERSFEHVLREGGLRRAMLQNRKSH